MNTPEENLVHWLRDAHAMQKQAIESFENQLDRLKNYPEMRAWVADHVQAAKLHREQIRECIERHGGSASGFKDMAMTLMGKIQELTGSFAEDEVLKNVITDYAFKHYQIACYVSLAAAAQEAGDPQTQRVVEGMLQTDRALADRLLPYIPRVTREYMSRDLAGVTAGR